jgi:hypothetical protein
MCGFRNMETLKIRFSGMGLFIARKKAVIAGVINYFYYGGSLRIAHKKIIANSDILITLYRNSYKGGRMKITKGVALSMMALLLFWAGSTNAKQTDIPREQVPKDVIAVLNKYLKILSTSPSLEACAPEVAKISAGHMLSQSGSISQDVLPYSLKKDYENVKFYKVPAVITRVVFIEDDYDGYGPTLIQGSRYKIWIAKKDGVAGLPAPIPIIKPKKGAPKIVTTIGSL